MRLNPESLARSSSRHPWRTIVIWVAILAGSFALIAAGLFGDALTNGIAFTNEPESVQAQQLIEERLRGEEPDTEFVLVTSESATVEDPVYQEFVGGIQTEISSLGEGVVTGVGSYLTEDGPVSEDGRTVLLPVLMTKTDEDRLSEDATRLGEAVNSVDVPEGFETFVAGPSTLFNEFQTIIEEDIAKGESIGVIVALIVLVVVLGAVVAGLIPIVLAIFAIAVAMGLTALVGTAFEFSFFVQNMITMIGLAVGIDYSLFIVARYREERLHGRDKLEAIAHSGGTASRAVFFSGMTVVLALLGMLIIPTTIFRSLAAGAIFVVIGAVAAAMTLLPAILALMGDKVNALRVRKNAGRVEAGTGFWDRATRLVMRRPVVSLVAGVGLIAGARDPVPQHQDGDVGREHASRRHRVQAGVHPAAGELRRRPDRAVRDRDRRRGRIAGDPGRDLGPGGGDLLGRSVRCARGARGERRRRPGRAAPCRSAATCMRTARWRRIRDLRSAVRAGGLRWCRREPCLVGGETAFNVDFFDLADTYTPIVFAFVLGLSFLLLTVVFRSIVVPVKAILMNLLSVGAAYGLVVLFFQKGVGPGFVKDIAEFAELPAGRVDRGLASALPVLHPVRAVDGLPRLPADPDPGALRPHRRTTPSPSPSACGRPAA